MSELNKIPVFSKRIFWDVDLDSIDYHNKSGFIIQRVFERGDIDDIRAIRRYYNEAEISHALLNAKFLPLHIVYLASAVIDRPLTDFRCYKHKR